MKILKFDLSFQGTEAYVAKIEGYNVDVKLWPPNLAEIRHHFTPKREIIDSVEAFLRNTTSTLHGQDDDRKGSGYKNCLIYKLKYHLDHLNS